MQPPCSGGGGGQTTPFSFPIGPIPPSNKDREALWEKGFLHAAWQDMEPTCFGGDTSLLEDTSGLVPFWA